MTSNQKNFNLRSLFKDKRERPISFFLSSSFFLLVLHFGVIEIAMGGSYKGNSSGHRGRPYGLMLLVAFGAALIGVMVLHKLRERRIFDLLVQQKDRDLISLQLFLQVNPSLSLSLSRMQFAPYLSYLLARHV
jgi:hypothetical protein